MDLFSKLQKHLTNTFNDRGISFGLKILDLTDESYTKRKGTSSADFPEFVLQPTNLMGPQFASSSHSKVTVKYQVQMSSGELTITVINSLLAWFLETMIYIEANKGIFLWNDYPPIISVKFGDAPIGLSNNEANRNKLGFSSVVSFDVELRLLTASFRGNDNGPTEPA